MELTRTSHVTSTRQPGHWVSKYLREVLYGVDVVVRRRADQAHARDGVTSLGYVRRHLNNHITCPMNYFLNLPPVSHSAELQERAPYAFFTEFQYLLAVSP